MLFGAWNLSCHSLTSPHPHMPPHTATARESLWAEHLVCAAKCQDVPGNLPNHDGREVALFRPQALSEKEGVVGAHEMSASYHWVVSLLKTLSGGVDCVLNGSAVPEGVVFDHPALTRLQLRTLEE